MRMHMQFDGRIRETNRSQEMSVNDGGWKWRDEEGNEKK